MEQKQPPLSEQVGVVELPRLQKPLFQLVLESESVRRLPSVILWFIIIADFSKSHVANWIYPIDADNYSIFLDRADSIVYLMLYILISKYKDIQMCRYTTFVLNLWIALRVNHWLDTWFFDINEITWIDYATVVLALFSLISIGLLKKKQ